jgi:hypothetical protein
MSPFPPDGPRLLGLLYVVQVVKTESTGVPFGRALRVSDL